ncbi:hypothetical protein MCU78_32860, partial [Streptomyces sp. TYQ1024]
MPDHSERRARRRRLLARFAVAACLPYLTLKLLWVAGADAGVRDLGSPRPDPARRAARPRVADPLP